MSAILLSPGTLCQKGLLLVKMNTVESITVRRSNTIASFLTFTDLLNMFNLADAPPTNARRRSVTMNAATNPTIAPLAPVIKMARMEVIEITPAR